MKPFKEWAEEYGIVIAINSAISISSIPISESEFTGKVKVEQMRVLDKNKYNAKVLRR